MLHRGSILRTSRYGVGPWLLLAVLGLASPALAQDARENVVAQLKVVTDTKADDGFTSDDASLGRSVLLGVLEHESSVYLELTLDARRDYYIAARCDTGCSNLDTRVMMPDYSLLAEDALPNDQPKMDLRPQTTGPHLLAVRMVSCPSQVCYFGVVILSRPAR